MTNNNTMIGGTGFSEKDFDLIKQLVQSRLESNSNLEYESIQGYEIPPRTQFSMLKKPSVVIKSGSMTFNKAALLIFENASFIIPMLNRKKKRIAVIPCAEEEPSSVQWSRLKGDKLVAKKITTQDFVETIYQVMGWDRNNRYKALGRLTMSEEGPILVFELQKAIEFKPAEEFVDPKTGRKRKREIKNYLDVTDETIGSSYAEYAAAKQMNLFEDLGQYTDTTGIPKSDDDGLETETNVLTNDIHNKNMTAELPVEDNKLVRSEDDEFRKETENIN
ncbi:MAG: hypothetical protein IKG47_09100 [Oscillospiraceae bacterium]|nr:hypothetical protein [Oscillospiraceae bacterium]